MFGGFFYPNRVIFMPKRNSVRQQTNKPDLVVSCMSKSNYMWTALNDTQKA